MSPWWAPSATATRLAVPAAALFAAAGASAQDTAFQRLLAAVETYGPATEEVSAGTLVRACGSDLRCAAERVVAATQGRARLERRAHPDSDTIRWVTTRASVRGPFPAGPGRSRVVLEQFGRKVVPELQAALAALPAHDHFMLDLRGNQGGDFGRMLAAAGALVGAVPKALYLTDAERTRALAIPGSGTPPDHAGLMVLVGPQTASSGEVLAALLRRYGNAEVAGSRTRGKDYLLRVVPLDHGWRLLLPAERIVVPGETLTGGLRPDLPLPQTLALGGEP